MRSAANVNQLASASKPSSHSLSSAVAVPTEITVEAFVSQLKVDHKNDLHRLKSFLSHERHVYDSNNARIAASVVIDSILTGYKKQSVYVLKLVAKKRKAENLSASERSECILEAANQMLKRYERDTKNLMETLQNERGRDVKALIDKGASKSKIVEAEQRRDVYDLDQIRKEQGKLMFALAGLSIDTELLGVASEPFKSPGDGLKFRVNSSEDLSEDGFDEDGEYDHLSTFLQRLVMWRLWVLRVEDVYSRSLPCLYSLFYAAHTKVPHLQLRINHHDGTDMQMCSFYLDQTKTRSSCCLEVCSWKGSGSICFCSAMLSFAALQSAPHTTCRSSPLALRKSS